MIADRAAEVSAVGPGGTGTSGSGFLVGPRLVLTARHVVGEAASRGGSGSESVVRPLKDNTKYRCRTVWASASRDLALLEIMDGDWTQPPVRLGCLTTSTPHIPCEAVGFPRAQLHDDGWGDSEHLTGSLNPATAVVSDRHQLVVTSGSAPDGWPGMSGAGVVSGDLVVGVIVEDRVAFGGARLVVEPIAAAAGDEDFVRAWRDATGNDPPELESVEFAPVFGHPGGDQSLPSPGSLLRATASVVRFRGRDRELEQLRTWCSGDGFCLQLVSARGGEGKTRLARQFAAELRQRGWTAGTVRPSAPQEALQRAAATTTPLLLIVDYAETRVPQVARIIEQLADYRGSFPVRLLLLARSDGEWWKQLTEQFPVPVGQPLRLGPVVVAPEDRTRAYQEATEDLSRALARVPGVPPTRTFPLPPSGALLPGAEDTSVLALHAAALVALLQQGPGAVGAPSGEHVWDTLLRHERRYWRRAAEDHRLDLREEILDSAVTCTVLCLPADEPEARALLAHIPGLHDQPHDIRLRVGSLLRHLYPGQTDDAGPWSPLQPDRLAEHFAVATLRAEPRLLRALLAAGSDAQIEQAFTVLSRATVHRPEAATLLRDALVEAPPLTAHAVRAAPRTDHPGPLAGAVMEVIGRGLLSAEELRRVADGIPFSSVTLGPVALDAYEALVQQYCMLLEDHPGYLPDYVHAVAQCSDRLSAAGRVEEALDLYQEALEAVELLEYVRPDVAFSHMLSAFANYSNLLANAGRYEDALRVARALADVYRRVGEDIAAADETSVLMHVVARLKVAGYLVKTGDTDEALAESEQVLAMARRMTAEHAGMGDDLLAMTLQQAAMVLKAAGLCDRALALQRELVACWERGVAKGVDGALSKVAWSLLGLAEDLRDSGQTMEALALGDRAVGIWRDLMVDRPDSCRPHLATALYQRGCTLAATGRYVEAAEAARESAHLLREPTRVRPREYRLGLVEVLANAVLWSGAAGEPHEAELGEFYAEFDALRAADPEAAAAVDRTLAELRHPAGASPPGPAVELPEQGGAPVHRAPGPSSSPFPQLPARSLQPSRTTPSTGTKEADAVPETHIPLSEQLRQQLDADPHNAALRLGLASLLSTEGHREEALAEVATVLQREPGSAEAQRLMCHLLNGPTAPQHPDPRQPSPEPPAIQPPAPHEHGAPPQPVAGPVAGPVAEDPPDNLLEVQREAVRLTDVAGMATVKRRLELTFLGPARNQEVAQQFGHRLRGGLLLYGPPGCGKTFIARALAGELGANFLSVTLADTLDMWMGNSERNIRSLFVTARRHRPCVLFIDEMDALGGRRSRMHFSGMRNVVAQLLTEMDSVNSDNEGIFVLGATNQPWDVDAALRRPGRLDRMLFVAPPDEQARAAIIHGALDGRPVGAVDVNQLVAKTSGYSGADLVHLCQSAMESALADSLTAAGIRPVSMRDFTQALKEVSPSTVEWFESAKNVVKFSNQDHAYDELIAYLDAHGRRR
ncbi:AAA family ATPase [Streptomyces sp. NPDC004069]